MSQTDIEKIKERLGIKEVVESYIKLEKAGKNYKGRCPFHNEKTPSFFVSPDRNSYYCFGCGAKGDIFSFVQQFEGVDFPGSLKLLADRAGITLTKTAPDADIKYRQLKKVLEEATKVYEQELIKNKAAREYLMRRGLSEQTIIDWRIGFAKDGWQNLYDVLIAKGYSNEILFAAGLIKKNERGGYYDAFRSRIMFPIFNSVGEVIAFSGRIFGGENDTTAKYINSPESDVFKKSEILYGFHRAKSSIRKHDFSILVEGQMDLIMCHQAGYTNTVASSGTALTEKQLQMIARISPKMVIAYDSDSAGFKASERAWQMALSLGMDVKIAPITGGKDPADVIKDSPEKWKETVRKSEHIITVLIRHIQAEQTDPRSVGQVVATKIVPFLFSMKSKIDQSHFVHQVAEQLGISEEAMYSEIAQYKPEQIANTQTESRKTHGRDPFAAEKRIFGLLAWQEKATTPCIDVAATHSTLRRVLGDEYDSIKRVVSDDIEDIMFTIENLYEDPKVVARDTEELLKNIEKKYLQKQLLQLQVELKRSEQVHDDSGTDALLVKINEVSRKIQGLTS